MRIYVAATYSRRKELLTAIVKPLHAAGHEVTSSWLLEDYGDDVLGRDSLQDNPALGAEAARICYADIDRAEVFVVLTDVPSSTGGYLCELGWAQGRGKLIEIVGPIDTIFCCRPGDVRHATLTDFLQEWGCEMS